MKSKFVCSASALALLLGLSVAGAEAAPSGSLEDEVSVVIDGLIADRQPEGVAIRIAQNGQLLYDRSFGAYNADSVINVASTAKWVTAATIMTLVDEQVLDLYEPIGTYLPQVKAPLSTATLQQLLSHTSGIGGLQTYQRHLSLSPDMSLLDAGLTIAADPLDHLPGEVFAYGGASFQLAGAIAVKTSGKRWSELFQSRIAGPLNMADSYYGHPMPEFQGRRDLDNPGMGGGLDTSLNDYWKFLTMIFHHGDANGHRILSAGAIKAMETNRVIMQKIVYSPRTEEQSHYRYGIGIWCEQINEDNSCPVVSSPGAWGAYSWIDRSRGAVGLLIIRDQGTLVTPWVERLKTTVNNHLDSRSHHRVTDR